MSYVLKYLIEQMIFDVNLCQVVELTSHCTVTYVTSVEQCLSAFCKNNSTSYQFFFCKFKNFIHSQNVLRHLRVCFINFEDNKIVFFVSFEMINFNKFRSLLDLN